MPVAFRSSSPASPELDFECCNVKELRAYLASGGNANRCHDGTTLLYNAARCGDDARVQLLLQSGGHDSLLVKGPNGSYPLHAAACAKAPACISLLMDAHMEKDCQFDPHQLRDSFGYTPLDNAKSDTASLQVLYQPILRVCRARMHTRTVVERHLVLPRQSLPREHCSTRAEGAGASGAEEKVFQ